MTWGLAAGLATLASAPAVLVTLVAGLLLAGLRAWALTVGLTLTRHVLHLLDGAIAALGIMFLALVFTRFITVG